MAYGSDFTSVMSANRESERIGVAGYSFPIRALCCDCLLRIALEKHKLDGSLFLLFSRTQLLQEGKKEQRLRR